MADLYRKSALERISSPEQLDKTIKIISPLSWIAIMGATLIAVVTIVWSFVGRIPLTVSTNGIIAAPISTNSVYTSYSGTVTAIYIGVGDELHYGTKLMDISQTNGELNTITSDQVGTLSEVLYAVGDAVSQNSEVVRVSPKCTGSQVVVAYASVSDAKKVVKGMEVNVYPASVDSQSNGHMVGRVINIDSIATSNTSMSYVLGKDNNLTSSIAGTNAVVAITCELYPDAESSNGYFWTNENGNSAVVTNGSLCTVKIITDEVRPISKLYKKLAEIWGE